MVRITWHQAVRFCELLSKKTGYRAKLPTEAQWEWACRAGTATPLWYGDADTDFGAFENLSGREKKRLAFPWGKHPAWFLRDDRFGDGAVVTAPVGSYKPNPWGLKDMHGNVSEWTSSRYGVTLSAEVPVAKTAPDTVEYVIRGGSWDHRPRYAYSTARWKYPAWRKIHHVGMRVVLEVPARKDGAK